MATLDAPQEMTKSGKPKPRPKRLAHAAPDWNACKCVACGCSKHWRYMPAEWTQLVSSDGDEDEWEVKHFCVPCMARKRGVSEEQVMEDTLANPIARKKYRADQYQQAMTNKRAEFEMQDGSVLIS